VYRWPTKVATHTECINDLQAHDDCNCMMNMLMTTKSCSCCYMQWMCRWPTSIWWLQLHNERVNDQQELQCTLKALTTYKHRMRTLTCKKRLTSIKSHQVTSTHKKQLMCKLTSTLECASLQCSSSAAKKLVQHWINTKSRASHNLHVAIDLWRKLGVLWASKWCLLWLQGGTLGIDIQYWNKSF